MDITLHDIQKLIKDSLKKIEEDEEVRIISFITSMTSNKAIAIEEILVEAKLHGLDEEKVYKKIQDLIHQGILKEKRKGYVVQNI